MVTTLRILFLEELVRRCSDSLGERAVMASLVEKWTPEKRALCAWRGDGSVGGGGLEREGADELSSSLDCWVHSSSLRRKVWVGNRGLGY